MEKVTLRRQSLNKALTRLEHALEKLKSIEHARPDNQDEKMIFQDSCIKRFEFCFDLFWKLLKEYLEYNESVYASSPKNVIHACFKQKIIDQEETDLLFAMIDDRNRTAHDYDETMAQKIAEHINNYCMIMKAVSLRLN